MFDGPEFNAPAALADLKRAASGSLAQTRDIIRQYEAASRDIQRTMRRSRRLREESAALRAALESMNPDGALARVLPRRPESA
jgi:hypothetical protein